MMRKAKPQQIDQKELRIAKKVSNPSVDTKEVIAFESGLEETQLEPLEQAISENIQTSKNARTLNPQKDRIDRVAKISERIPASPIIKRAKKKVLNHIDEVQETNDDRSLIRLLIIVILLLIILNLILDLLPPVFTGVLGLIILILIFLWLLNYL